MDDIKPVPAPDLNIPESKQVCDVSIINTTLDLSVPSTFFGDPVIKGHESWNLPTFCFYIKNRNTGKEVLFDAGSRKDWWNFPPAVDNVVRSVIPGLNIKYGVDELLQRGGVDPNNIKAVIWSHWHWDHVGDMSKFPKSTEIVVGPTFKDAFLPGYPTNPESPFFAEHFEDRTLRELQFDEGLKIGQFKAHDFFGDGSFYILNVPGHAVGHISGLVRTTDDTFIFLGGDVCHYGGMHKPTKYMPMPAEIPKETPLDKPFSAPCPCSIFTKHHPAAADPVKARTTPYYSVTLTQPSWYMDPPLAQDSINKMAEFDASENVFICIAHDPKLLDVCDFFPHATMNQWKSRGWKKQNAWAFLNELPDENGKPTRGWIAKGLLFDGKEEVPADPKWKTTSFDAFPELCIPTFYGKSEV